MKALPHDRWGSSSCALWWHRAGASRRRDVGWWHRAGASRRRDIGRALGAGALASLLALSACKPYDPDLLPPRDGGNGAGGAGGMDGSVAGSSGDGGPQEGGTDGCASDAVEECNRVDDDCNGEVDDGARAFCEQTIIHAQTECVPFANTARCVLLSCLEGYDNCDGNPANGCEPLCDCNPCDDAGGEDAGDD